MIHPYNFYFSFLIIRLSHDLLFCSDFSSTATLCNFFTELAYAVRVCWTSYGSLVCGALGERTLLAIRNS